MAEKKETVKKEMRYKGKPTEEQKSAANLKLRERLVQMMVLRDKADSLGKDYADLVTDLDFRIKRLKAKMPE